MLNIYSNAIKFTDRNGKIVIHIEKKIDHEKQFLMISITDTGEGIKEEDPILSKIYIIKDDHQIFT